MVSGRHWVIWGSSGHAKVLADTLAHWGDRIVALIDNDSGARSVVAGAEMLYGRHAFVSWMSARADGRGQLFAAVAVGGDRGSERLRLMEVLQSHGLVMPPIIHVSAYVAASARIGMGSQVLANATVAADAVVGAGCIVNNGASVDHECQLADGVHVAPGATLCGCVSVGANSFIGAGATVLPRVKIGYGATVGAGALAVKDVSDGETVVGVPARRLRP